MNESTTTKKNKNGFGLGCLVMIAVSVVILSVIMLSPKGQETPTKPNLNPLYCVKGNLNTFIISNADSLTYHNIDIKLNGEYKYHLNGLLVKSNEFIPLSSFIDDEGTRFNIVEKEVIDVAIYIDNYYYTGTKVEL